MPLVIAGIAPHGTMLVPALSPQGEGATRTRAAMEELGRRWAAAQPAVTVVLTPHGTRVEGAICLASAARAVGVLRHGDRAIEHSVPLDQRLTALIASLAQQRGLPVALASMGGNAHPSSTITLDWGSSVPLWFLGHGQATPGHGDPLAPPPAEAARPPAVIIAPSRSVRRGELQQFGQLIAQAAHADGRRVALLASCDWAHTHAASGPYGLHPRAAEVDRMVRDAVVRGRLEDLHDLSDELASAVAVDGLWQALMLAGALRATPLVAELLSYEAPSYFGMLVACFRMAEPDEPAT